jgi:hypothetical protein
MGIEISHQLELYRKTSQESLTGSDEQIGHRKKRLFERRGLLDSETESQRIGRTFEKYGLFDLVLQLSSAS